GFHQVFNALARWEAHGTPQVLGPGSGGATRLLARRALPTHILELRYGAEIIDHGGAGHGGMARVIAHRDLVGDGVTRTDGAPVIRLADRRALRWYRRKTRRHRSGVHQVIYIVLEAPHENVVAEDRDGLTERAARIVRI